LDSSSVHQQEFFTVHTAVVYVVLKMYFFGNKTGRYLVYENCPYCLY